MRLRSTVLVLAVVLASSSARAVPAPPFPIELSNPDGTTVRAHMLGDERISWFEAMDGFTVVREPVSGFWRYARLGDDGRLVATSAAAGRVDPRGLGLQPNLAPAPEVLRKMRVSRQFTMPGDPNNRLTGQVPNLVLLVKFKNQTPRLTASQFDEVFNGATGSFKEFYREVSRGKLDMVSTIVGWIPLPNDDAYYAYNDQNPDGQPQQMLRDAVAYLETQGFDFTRFDSNSDGIIDAVDVIHSGMAYETTGNPRYIHSHFGDLRWMGLGGSFKTSDGITFVAYHTEPEFAPDGTRPTQIGVICHETAHFFGLPDLYDYGYDSAGSGVWSLMASGAWSGPDHDGSVPAHPDAWSKYKLGFIEPREISDDAAGVRLTSTLQSGDSALVRAYMPDGQYFILENRQTSGYDTYLPAGGLLIWHVDERQNSNDDQNHYLVDLEQADGLRELNRYYREWGDTGDVFPTASNTAFTPVSKPSSVAYGQTLSAINITNIRRDGADVTFDVSFRNPKQLGESCQLAADCVSGFCADGVCCDRACNAGPCDACSIAAGAPDDGTCTALDGNACDDGNLCTENDRCTSFYCLGEGKACADGECHVGGQCDPSTGRCRNVPRPNGTACSDGDACTLYDKCQDGACASGEPMQCVADACQLESHCDAAIGACVSQPAPEGAACEGGKCEAGVCAAPPADDSGPCGCSAGGQGAAGSAALVGLVALAAIARRRWS